MTKSQLINGLEEITNQLKGIEEAEFTSCITYEAWEQIDTLFSTFEEEHNTADDNFTTYDPKKDSLSPMFPSVQDLFNLSIRKPVEAKADEEIPEYLQASLRLLGV